MRTISRVGLLAAPAVVAAGLVMAVPVAANAADDGASECMRGIKPGTAIKGGVIPNTGVRTRIMGTRDTFYSGGGYRRKVTVMLDGGAEGWLEYVGAGVPGDYDSRSRFATLLWCEKIPKPKPKPKPPVTGGGGGGTGGAGGATGGTLLMTTSTANEPDRYGTIRSVTQID